MPIYEEKLISPLAVRFTQEHIKTLFRDGHVVESTCEEIEAGPAVGDYDIVLRVPFPAIEIIRWSAPGAKESDRHWYSLDNRRLYCLQRAAAKYWPKRVAAAVEILYVDPGAVRRKYDSTTFGCTVTVSPSCKVAALFRWDWRAEVANAKFVTPLKETQDDRKGWEMFASDDKKDQVDALSNVSGAADSSEAMVARACEALASHGAAAEAPRRKANGSSSSSTAAPSEQDEDESFDSGDASPAQGSRRSAPASVAAHADAAAVRPVRKPKSSTPAPIGGPIAARAVAEITAQLRADGDGRVRVPRWAERYGEPLGGVGIRQFLESRPESFQLEFESGGQWTAKVVGGEESTSSTPPQSSAAEEGEARASRKAPASSAPAAAAPRPGGLVERAVAEIQSQLDPSGVPTYVRIPDWNRRYLRQLGDLKQFAGGRPDLFVVVPCGGGFRIACAKTLRRAQQGAFAAQMAVQAMHLERCMAAQMLYAQAAFW